MQGSNLQMLNSYLAFSKSRHVFTHVLDWLQTWKVLVESERFSMLDTNAGHLSRPCQRVYLPQAAHKRTHNPSMLDQKFNECDAGIAMYEHGTTSHGKLRESHQAALVSPPVCWPTTAQWLETLPSAQGKTCQIDRQGGAGEMGFPRVELVKNWHQDLRICGYVGYPQTAAGRATPYGEYGYPTHIIPLSWYPGYMVQRTCWLQPPTLCTGQHSTLALYMLHDCNLGANDH